MTEPEKWEPTPEDIGWTEALIATLRDGGVWAVPACLTTYTVHKERKLVEFEPLGPPGLAGETHDRIVTVFGRLGYAVAPRQA